MPNAAPRTCTYPRCGNYAVESGRCKIHRRADHKNYNLSRKDDPFNQFYQTKQWRKVRNLHIKRQPLCAHCQAKGLTTVATEVDHIVPIKDGGAKLDRRNLQSLCHKCHSIKTARETARRIKGGAA